MEHVKWDGLRERLSGFDPKETGQELPDSDVDFVAHGSGLIPPIVGLGITVGVGSDSYPYTIVEVINDKTCVIQGDNAIRTDNNGLSEMQIYKYIRNVQKGGIIITRRKDGKWRRKGDTLKSPTYHLGYRRAYRDPCF